MAEFSISEAVGASFRVAGRKPAAVLAWGLAYMAIGFGPVLLLAALMVPGILAAAQSGGEEVDPAVMASLMGPMLAFYPVTFLAGVTAQAVLMGAVFRSILEPEASRWAYLRLGGQELWLALVALVIGFVIGIGALVLILPLAGIGAALAVAARQAMGEAGVALALIPIGLFGVAVIVWVMLRLSMAYPMSFSDRTFRLFESWTLTRGQTLRLLGLGLAVVAIAIVFETVLFLLGAAAVFGLFAGEFRALEAGNLADVAGQLSAAGVVNALLLVGLAGFGSLITFGPFADAYRQLRATAA